MSRNISSSIKDRVATLEHLDSQLVSQFDNAANQALNKINQALSSAIKSIRKNRINVPKMPKLDQSVLSQLKKNSVEKAVMNSEASGWNNNNSISTFWQSDIHGSVIIAGLPISANALWSWNFQNSQSDQRFTYQLNYNKNDFLNKLGVDQHKLKNDLKSQLDFKQIVNYKEVINSALSSCNDITGIVKKMGSNWNDMLEMPMNEFRKIYNKDILKSKMADAEKLKTYYSDYLKKKKDSVVQSKLNALDSQIVKIKEQSGLYAKLINLKEKADELMLKIETLKRAYEDKSKMLMEGYNVVKDVINRNNDLSGLQKFMLKVKGLNVGQHTLSVGNLVLQNYLQNGVSFEYETDKIYFLITKGSQRQFQFPGNLFQNAGSNQSGINEYYQFNSRYKLTGISVGRGNRSRNYQQMSLMNFKKVDNSINPSAITNTINVYTLSNHMRLGDRKKISYDFSKSQVVQEHNYSSYNKAMNEGFFKSIALNIKYDFMNAQTGDRQKFDFFYSTLSYNNPGLNGGISRPGLQLNHLMDKKIGTRFKINNRLTYYSFNYGNSASFKSLRERVSASYKIGKIRAGIMLNANYGNQFQYNPKLKYKSNSIDMLLTGQTTKRWGNVIVSTNLGAGYGYNQQEGFSKSKDWSYYANTSVALKGFSFDIDLDKFNTRNTEVYLFDSSALLLTSSFNLQAALSYSTAKGNVFQAGLLYKELTGNEKQFFISATTQWSITKRISWGGNLNLPISNVANQFFANNIFNSRITYNIYGHDK